MVIWSVASGILGISGSGIWMLYHHSQADHDEPQRCWFAGLAALLPAWLLAFIGLLAASASQGTETDLPLSALFSSGVGLLSVVLTDAIMRRLQASGHMHQPVIYWLLGVGSLVPAWCIALINLLQW